MADSVTGYRTLISNVNSYITALQALNLMQDRMASDPTLAAAMATAAQAAGRSDLTTQDFTNVANAITQFNFTFNSGTPTQKSYLYKLL